MLTGNPVARPVGGPRLSGASWTVLAVSLFFVTLFGAFVWLHLSGPSDGALLQPGTQAWHSHGVELTPVYHGVGLQPGDLVTAVEGRSVESWASDLFRPWETRPRWETGQTISYTVEREGRPVDVAVHLGEYPLGTVLRNEWGATVFALVFWLVSAFVFFKRPAVPAARVLLLGGSGMMSATAWSFGLQMTDVVGSIGFWLYRATTNAGYMLLWIALVHFWLVFPQPHAAIARRRWVIPVLYAMPYVVLPVYAAAMWPGSASIVHWLGRAFAEIEVMEFSYLALGLVAAVWQYRSPLDTASRQQVRWVWAATLLVGGTGLAFVFLPQLALDRTLLSFNALAVLGLLLPVALAFAILRYRLFDIDIIVNRTLVYGTLTAGVAGIYVLVVGSLGALFAATGSLVISLLAAGVVAVLFQPLRGLLQRCINRWMYGQRDEPYAVLAHLGRRLEGTLPPGAILPAVVEIVAHALKVPYVAMALKQSEHEAIVAAFGHPGTEQVAVPLVYQGRQIGRLLVAFRARGERFGPSDTKLFNDLARHTGVIAHSVQLAEDLQQARERLVLAREEERRRLRRELHDGLGPSLASITLKLDAARNQMARDPAASGALLAELKAQTQRAIADIRRLAYELRPPALDELGLLSALREHVGRLAAGVSSDGQAEFRPVRVTLDVPDKLPTLPAAVEVAAYRIAIEALTNVERHAHAHNCVLRLAVRDRQTLDLEIADDGIGLAPDRIPGVGVTSMKERALELGGSCLVESVPGGGTRVLAQIPVGGA